MNVWINVIFVLRCYNCGEFANHIAAKCQLGPQPKRCHNCKSEDHLVADCPSRTERPPQRAESTEQNGSIDGDPSQATPKPSIDQRNGSVAISKPDCVPFRMQQQMADGIQTQRQVSLLHRKLYSCIHILLFLVIPYGLIKKCSGCNTVIQDKYLHVFACLCHNPKAFFGRFLKLSVFLRNSFIHYICLRQLQVCGCLESSCFF